MIINENATKKILKNNILALAQEAQNAKKQDSNVINSTSGMLMKEDGTLYEFEAVKRAVSSLSAKEKYGYANTAGTPEFSRAITKWIFGEFEDEVRKNNYLACLPTPGGSGALSLVFANYVRPGETIMLPNHMWEIYLAYAYEMGFNTVTYNLANSRGLFDFESVKLNVELLKKKQDRILILLNDPCENPTGFCMKDEDYDNLVDLVHQNPNTKFVFLMDMAYFDFYNENSNIIRKRYLKMLNTPENAIVLFAFSGSKSFGLYGLRIGALLCVSKDENETKLFTNASVYSSRARWSSASTLGMNIITKLVLEEENHKLFSEEVKKVCKMLANRSEAFLASAKEAGLETLPYEKGFFICVPCRNPDHMMASLHQDKVYVIATRSCLRIALCAISVEEARVLPKIIKGRMLLEE